MPTPTTRTQTTRTRTRTRTTPASDAALRRALEPVEPERFLAEHWERRPLHVARGERGRFDDLLSAREAERLVTEPGLRAPGFRLVKAGTKIDPRSYTADIPWRPQPFTGTAEVGRVLAEFEAGATIVLQGLHLSRLALARFCRGLEARLGHPVQTNAYWTPRRSQGLPVHHDTHDVFVLQVEGSKRWLVYEPALELPLRHQRYSAELGAPGEPVLDATLSPGDTLYLPRGWLHEAVTSAEDSLHLTIGANVRTWLDAFHAALARCEDDVELRRAVAADAEVGGAALERLAARFDPDEVAAAMRERFVLTRRPILDGQLEALRALETLRPDDVVERRETVIADFDGVRLVFEGKTLRFPAHAREEVDALVGAGEPVRISELPGRLDDQGRLVLARRLVREGFLRPA
jgi:ribosomal protein L16 Arg81 hydroxylase